MFTRKRIGLVMIFSGLVGAIGQGVAHTGATGIVKERMEAMKSLGDNAKIVGDMLKGQTPFEITAVESAAFTFIEHGEHIPMLFPDTDESRTGSKSEALPAIWTNWEDFTAMAETFTENSRVLASVAGELKNGEKNANDQRRAIRAAFFRTAKSCSGCHERFRLDQD